jgi:DNA (cytosine-5)-methyltransferase 1
VNYYNEFDPKAAAWIRELMRLGFIPEGHIDTRSIVDVTAGDLAGYRQCHFFAGIGGWSAAFRLAGILDDEEADSASCPCQPFSDAGLGKGVFDPRHLWPYLFPLIEKRRPAVVYGEQVASKAALGWLDGVQSDMEGAGYAFGANDLCSASVGAPTIRQRLFWVAESDGWKSRNRDLQRGGEYGQQQEDGGAGGVGNPEGLGRNTGEHDYDAALGAAVSPGIRGIIGRLVDAKLQGLEGQPRHEQDGHEPGRVAAEAGRSIAQAGGVGYWNAFDVLYCTDDKARRIEPGTFPLAHGIPGRVGLLRGYGNAINPVLAAEFIKAHRAPSPMSRKTRRAT